MSATGTGPAGSDAADATTPRPVVTLFESYGAGAEAIGRRVAERLASPYHQQAFSSEEIESGEGLEKVGMMSRAFHAISGSFAGPEGGRSVVMAQRDNRSIIEENNEVVWASAGQGGVILGRNATYILANRANTLHVKLDAPREVRIDRMVAAGLDEKVARRRQRNEDQIRGDMSVNLYHWDPRENDHFDLVLNTGQLDDDTCVDIIVAALGIKAGVPVED